MREKYQKDTAEHQVGRKDVHSCKTRKSNAAILIKPCRETKEIHFLKLNTVDTASSFSVILSASLSIARRKKMPPPHGLQATSR